MICVVAALIESEGKILVCQRRRGSSFELLWEFPGGKKEADESPPQALARELREELGVEADIGEEVYRTVHQYREMSQPIELIFFRANFRASLGASAGPAELENRVFEQIQWRTPESLRELQFLPADKELIEKLASGALRL